MTDDDWTPYGLEPFRQSRLWRRRATVFAVVLVVALAYVGFMQTLSPETGTSLSTFGGDGGTVSIENPDAGPATPDATLTLTPGELNVPQSTLEASQERGSQSPATPEGSRPAAEPINWMGLLVQWGLPLALLLAGYLLGRGRSHRQEVNYGIYKGAMPMETISARYRHLVHTTRATYRDPFGKRRADYLPDDEPRPGPTDDEAPRVDDDN